MNKSEPTAPGLQIRRPRSDELSAVRCLVQTVVDEVYGGLWAPPPLPVAEEGWHLSWIALSHAEIIGVVLTSGEWLDDLWVLASYRRHGVGRALLERGEAEILSRGHQTLRLRVLRSNVAATRFYSHNGWQIAREFPHEQYPIAMLEMTKSFSLSFDSN